MPMHLTHELRAQGVGTSEIRRKIRTGELHPLRRGAFATEPDEGTARHLQLIRATLPTLSDGSVLSHVSAAVLHNLPVDERLLGRVTVTRPSKGGSWVGPQLHRYRTPLADSDVETVDGMCRTVMARTVVDLARCGDLAMAVAAADAGLRMGLASQALDQQLTAARRRRGCARARVAVSLADRRSESVGESVSRVTMWQLGLPMPELQMEVVVGGLRYRPDFAWPELNVLGEFDGKVKYDRLRRPGESVSDVLMREKRREADLRAAGWWVVRWTWADAVKPERLERLLRPALERRR
ncbi:MAG: hypothetical protein QM619_14070 [Micropruina sp.]|uniref:hypothetical protein n=1 Tax=Micropruina sp. TaxID=2737536 RepID=UPI0039E54059